MAKTYTAFSEKIPGLTVEAAQWLTKVLAYNVHEEGRDGLFDLLGEKDDGENLDKWPDFEWSVMKWRRISGAPEKLPPYTNIELWLHSMEECSFDHLELVILALIRKFMPDYIFPLTYAEFCTEPHAGAFGGGVLVISREGVYRGNTYLAAEKSEDEILNRRDELSDYGSLVKEIEDKYNEEDLFDHVHMLKASEAESINDSGLDAQVCYMIKQAGTSWVRSEFLTGKEGESDADSASQNEAV